MCVCVSVVCLSAELATLAEPVELAENCRLPKNKKHESSLPVFCHTDTEYDVVLHLPPCGRGCFSLLGGVAFSSLLKGGAALLLLQRGGGACHFLFAAPLWVVLPYSSSSGWCCLVDWPLGRLGH